MIHRLIYLVFLCAITPGFGQELSESLSARDIQIGTPITLTYKARTATDSKIEFTARKNSIIAQAINEKSEIIDTVEFEILKEFSDSLYSQNDVKLWTGKYTITIWDSGTYNILGAQITIDDTAFEFESVRVFSSYTPKIDNLELYDIHERYLEIPENSFSTHPLLRFISENWWWIMALIMLIIGCLIFQFRKKRKHANETEVLSLQERTLLAIDTLERKKLWEKALLKEHFVQLSFILRTYLTERYSVSLLEKTTHETRLLLKEIDLSEDTISKVIHTLHKADMVKFAKSKPEMNSILQVSKMARTIINETSPSDQDHAE
ncbi:hypothetical protein OAU25_00875 [Crocinitomicaceae bacterium]|nr:hypothetical protein [Crocinitomicaceae bacterium]